MVTPQVSHHPEGDIFLVGSDGVNRSTDDGQTWQWRNNGIPPNLASLMFSMTMDSNKTIYAGSAYGVYRSTDNGGAWAQWDSGMPSGDVRALNVTSKGYVFAGIYNGGTYTGNALFRSINPVLGVPQHKEILP